MIDTRKRKVAMCSQCQRDNHHQCLGVVYYPFVQEWKECGCMCEVNSVPV
jgi:hypothetical protein